ALISGNAMAQDFTVGWNPRSGDVWVDAWLGDMNRYGSRYRDPFIDEVVRYYDAPRPLVVELLDRHWAPGDIYYACAMASIIGRPCRYVVDVYETDRGQGWGVIAKRLGIKPGSPEFHRLKQGFVPTYDRWARPIDLDDELRRAYPNRGTGHEHGNKGDKGKQVSGKGSPGHGNAQGNKGGSSTKSNHGGPSKGKQAESDHGGGSHKAHGSDHGSGKGQGDSKKGKGNGKG
ncbi:MAG TPA: hypothetical protein VGQ93_09025, partial [Lysobacter sp.]|nr:hypothetical protein [Lysobacter sp.]